MEFLALPLGLLVGLSLGVLGAGGSILIVPMLVYVLDLEPKASITALVVMGLALPSRLRSVTDAPVCTGPSLV